MRTCVFQAQEGHTGTQEATEVSIEYKDNVVQRCTLTSLELTECHYLAEAGCKSSCINLCKLPAQAFFNDVLSFPMTMTPEFSNISCVFDFGVAPHLSPAILLWGDLVCCCVRPL